MPRRRKTTWVVDFLRELHQGRDLPGLLGQVLRHALSLVPAAQSGTVLLLDKDAGVFRFAAAEGWDLEALSRIAIPKDQFIQSRLPLDRPSIIRNPLAQNVALVGEELAGTISALGSVTAVLSAPVTDGTELVGVLNLDSRDDPEAFTEADVRRLGAAWEEIALAVVAARSQAGLREREELLRLLLERWSDGVLIVAPDGTILEANPAAARQTGYSQDDLRGMNLGQLVVSPAPLPLADILARLRAEETFALEVEKRCKDGTTVRAEGVLAPTEHQGTPALLFLVRPLGDEQAKRRQALEALLRALPGIAGARDPREAVERIVAAAREIAHADHANVLLFTPKGDLAQVFDPHGAPPIPVRIRREGFTRWILETGQPLILDDIRPDGTTSPPVPNREGNPIPASPVLVREGIRSLVGLPLTVGGERRGILYVHSRQPGGLHDQLPVLSLLAAQAGVAMTNALLFRDLQEREGRLQTLFALSPVSLWIEDFSAVRERLEALRAQGVTDLRRYLEEHEGFAAATVALLRVIDVNQATLDLYGVRDRDDLQGRLPSLVPPEVLPLWIEELVAIWEGRPSFEGEGVNRTADGRPLHVRIGWRVLPGHEERYDRVLVSVHDLTARVEAEEALARRGAVLRAAAFAAETLLREPSLPAAVPAVLARLGEAAGVSRVYVFEESRDERGRPRVSQRYEWVAPGIQPQQENPALQDFPYADAGFARWVEAFDRGEPIHGRVADFPEEERPFLQAQDIRALAVLPIQVGGKRWGFVGFDDCVGERIWTEGELDALRIAAQALGAGLERAGLEEELRQRQAELAGLFGVAATLGEELELETLLTRVHAQLAPVVPSDAFLLALVEPNGRELRLAYGVEDGERLPPLVVPLDPGESLSAWVAHHRSPLLIRDVPQEWDRLPARARQVGRLVRSWVGVPLVVKDQVVGVLSVQSFAPGAFSEGHVRLLQAAAAPVAQAVRNAQAFAALAGLEQRLRAVEEASRKLKLAHNREDLFGTTLDLVGAVLGYGPCAILARQGEDLVVVAAHQELVWTQGKRLPLHGPGITVAAFWSREPVYAPDVRADPRYVPGNPTTRSELALPLVVGEEVLGVLDVESSEVDGIPPEDRELLGILASGLAVSWAGLVRLERLGDLSRRLARLHEASRTLSKASTQEEVCEQGVRALVETLGFEHANIGLGQGELLVPVAGAGALTGGARPFRRGEGIAGRVWETRAVLWGNLDQFPFARPTTPAIQSVLAVPIGDLGVIQVVATHRDAFTADDVELVGILARHVEHELRRVELEAELREQAIRDPLTELYNRRFLTEVLAREVERARRYGHPLTLVLADIDDFKRVNDRYGHGAGDTALCAVAQCLRESVRAGDYVFRYGGEEFVVLLPETGNGGSDVVRRLGDKLSAVEVGGVPGLRVSVSLGHVTWDPGRDGPASPEDLLQQADSVLYEIKRRRGGR